MFRRHFFLILAILVVVAMGVAGTFKILSKKPTTGPAGAGAAAGGPAAGRGGAAGGAGGPGGRGGAGGGALVAATSVTQRIFTDRLDVQGVAKGRQSVTLTATAGQVVDRVLFKSGDRVKKGQVLLELRKDAEDAGIVQAQAAVDLAKSTADRWNKLAAQGLAPAATAEQYQSAYITAESSLDTAKARLKDRVINAPFAGIIGLSDIAPGALISPGTAIATLDDTTVITVDIDVPDRNLTLVKEGTAIDATSDSYPGEHYAGKIAKIDTRIDERSRSFKARAELPNPGDRLKPGMLLHVGIDRGTHAGLAAPEASVQYSAGQASVYVITPRNGGGGGGGGGNAGGGAAAAPGGQPAGAAAGAAGGGRPGGGGGGGGFIALQRPIVAGIDECGFVEVKDGLALGDRIVADGLNKLTPNQPISLGGGRGGRGGPGAPGGPGGERGGPAAGPGAAGAVGPGSHRSGGPGRPGEDQTAAGSAGGRRGGGEARGRGPGAGPNARGGVQSAVASEAASRCATAQSMGRGGPAGAGGEGRGRGNRGAPPADAQAPGGGPARAGRRGVETAQ